MTLLSSQTLTAFTDHKWLASGPRHDVLLKLRAMHFEPNQSVRVFDNATGECIDFDLRPDAPSDDACAVALPEAPIVRPVGRPKLGVVAREVTLLPRHWDWLNRQPGGASVSLRRLVDESRKANEGRDTARASREAAYRFMSNIASHLANFEEATRALFAGNRERFEALVQAWPNDVRIYLSSLATASWSAEQLLPARNDGA